MNFPPPARSLSLEEKSRGHGMKEDLRLELVSDGTAVRVCLPGDRALTLRYELITPRMRIPPAEHCLDGNRTRASCSLATIRDELRLASDGALEIRDGGHWPPEGRCDSPAQWSFREPIRDG